MLLLAQMVCGQQIADPDFDARVARPAYAENHPKVLFDEAHNNFHTSAGRYKPFTDLLANDGYLITPNKEKFQPGVLQGYRILVIANALDDRINSTGAKSAAFTEEECDAVRDWVRAGGALLLIADHAPFGEAAENLAARFGVGMSKGYAMDEANFDSESGNRGFILYTRENRLLASHPITEGRDRSERIDRVLTFTGQSLSVPAGAAALLKMSDTAVDLTRSAVADSTAALERALNRQGGTTPERVSKGTSAAGRSQAVALAFGKGRVVILGEAAMLSAQLAGTEKKALGMNRKGIDNRQLGLNIMHWLSGLLN
jgi:hypothetical protein